MEEPKSTYSPEPKTMALEEDSAYSSDEHAPSSRIPSVEEDPLAKLPPRGVFSTSVEFYKAVTYFLMGGRYEDCPYFKELLHARLQVYSLCIVFFLWDRPHYRTGTFQQDMRTNLRNVAIPGTGIPLSLMCVTKPLAYLFLLVLYPLICLVAAFWASHMQSEPLWMSYTRQLLCPQDWFAYWRLNCRLASFHALVTKAKGYKMENKWDFLVAARSADISVSPWLDATDLVIKDKNEEGGMGIHFFKNAMQGGDWIIQEKLHNSEFISSLLPKDAPLSTLRVITSSRGGLYQDTTGAQSAPLSGSVKRRDVKALSCVFRAGRSGALTDHTSLLFDVDLATGRIQKGTTNGHWYQLGLSKVFTTKWLTGPNDQTHHCDTGDKLTGVVIPDIEEIQELCERAHFSLLPDVPLAGWDVALTSHEGAPMCLLEVNLSCNFFRGSFDQPAYFQFVDEYFRFLDGAKQAC